MNDIEAEIKEPSNLDKAKNVLFRKSQPEKKPEEPTVGPLDTDIDLQDQDLNNHLKAKNDSKTFNKFSTVKISDNRRPIYGVLTEPLRGNMKNTQREEHQISADTEEHSYIPKAHVQFLE